MRLVRLLGDGARVAARSRTISVDTRHPSATVRFHNRAGSGMQPNTQGPAEQSEQVAAEDVQQRRVARRPSVTSWALASAALVVGLGIGVLVGHSDPEDSTAYQALQDRLVDSRADVVAAEREGEDAAREAAREAEQSAQAAEDEMTSRAAELDQRETELVAREQAASASSSAPAPRPAASPSTAPRPAPAPNAAPAPAPAPAPNGNPGQANARGKAQDYLRFTAFSRSGLIEQLEYEGFSNADATWGVDGLGANWSEQAAKKAADYLEFTSFSRSGLIEQLEYEGFTPEQAEYGAAAVGY